MKEGWKKKKFCEILEKTETINPLQYPNTKFDYIDVSSVSNLYFKIENTQKIKGKDAPSRARRLVKENDVIFATVRPTLKRIAIIPKELDNQICSTGYFILRPNPEINHRYLFYSLFTKDFLSNMEKLQKGASYPAVTDNDMRNQELSFPTLPEQQRIVDILDQTFAAIDQAIENTEKNLGNVANLLEAKINQFFQNHSKKWRSKPINQLSEIKYGYTEKSNFSNVGPKFLRITDIQNTSGGWNKVAYCTISDEEMKKYKLMSGDIVFARTGATTGKSYLIENPPNAVFASYLIRLRINLQDKLLPKYLILFLKSKNYWDIIKKGLSGSTQGGFNASKLGNLVVPIPSIEEQLEFIDSIDGFSNAVDLIIHYYEKKLTLLQELKQSLLHKAFQGEL